jgi:hypothetical protein
MSVALNDIDAPKKRDWTKPLIGVGLSVVLLNAALTAVLVSQMASANAKVEKYDATFNQLQLLITQAKPQVKHYIGEFDHFAQTARHIGDVANRVLHGSVPDLVNDLAQSHWDILGQNVSTLAGAVKKAFDAYPGWEYNEQINMWAAYIESVANIVRTINPDWTTPAPQPTDDLGILNVVSYVVDWSSDQAEKTKWRNAAVTCVDLMEAAIPINWSGKYVWHNGHYYGSYDWNDWVNYNLPKVRDTCSYFAKIKSPPADEGGAVNDTQI